MKKAGIILICFFLINLARTAEYWTEVTDPNWSEPVAIISFNDTLYMSVRQGTGSLLWKSSDGENWESVSLSRSPFITLFVEHKGKLFGFARRLTTFGTDPTDHYIVMFDGDSWGILDSFFQYGEWSDVISFGDHLYATNTKGQMWRSLGENLDSPWEYSPAWVGYGIAGIKGIYFASYKGNLYLSANNDFSDVIRNDLYRLIDETQWNQRHPGWGYSFLNLYGLLPSHEINQNRLYWGSESGLLTFEDEVSFRGLTQYYVGGAPFFIQDQLHLINRERIIRQFRHPDSWDIAYVGATVCGPKDTIYEESVQFHKKTFIVPCAELWVLNQGVENYFEYEISTTDTILSGEESGSVFAFQLQVNIRDYLTGLRIINQPLLLEESAAISNQDIGEMLLIQTRERHGQIYNVDQWTLTSESDTVWQLPDLTSIEVLDGDVFHVRVRITPEAQASRVVQLVLTHNALEWEVNPHLQGQTSLMGPAFRIVQEQNPIPQVFVPTVYPNPARDRVHFIYTLSEPSHVWIKIYDQAGNLLTEISKPNSPMDNDAETIWDASTVPPGLYFATIDIQSDTGKRQFEKKKIIIER